MQYVVVAAIGLSGVSIEAPDPPAPVTEADVVAVYRAALLPQCLIERRVSNRAWWSGLLGLDVFFGFNYPPLPQPPAETMALVHQIYLASAARRTIPSEAIDQRGWLDGDIDWRTMRCVLAPTAVAFSSSGDRAAVGYRKYYDGGEQGWLVVLHRDGRDWAIEWDRRLDIGCGGPRYPRAPPRAHMPMDGLYIDSRWIETTFGGG